MWTHLRGHSNRSTYNLTVLKDQYDGEYSEEELINMSSYMSEESRLRAQVELQPWNKTADTNREFGLR